MIVKIKSGVGVPTVDDLENLQLGWSVTEKKLYIRDDSGTQDNPDKKIFEAGLGRNLEICSPVEWEEI
ncbi:MAG: hypothetical protein Pg6A_12640 [Termitinemataceae bacterium]|nr:MAG: hypothetical protein Pg6A_12640 [Termitinemataceae bacterium]